MSTAQVLSRHIRNDILGIAAVTYDVRPISLVCNSIVNARCISLVILRADR